MLQQEIAGLDFDRYLSVSSNPVHHPEPHHPDYFHNHHHQQQQQQHQQRVMYSNQQPIIQRSIEPTESSRSIPTPIEYLPSQVQHNSKSPIEVIDWCFKEQPQNIHAVLATSTSHQPSIQKLHSPNHYAYPINQQSASAFPSGQQDGKPSIAAQHLPSSSMLNLGQQNIAFTPRNSIVNDNSISLSGIENGTGEGMSQTPGLMHANSLPTPVSDMLPGTPHSQSSFHSNESCRSPFNNDNTYKSPSMNPPTTLKNAFTAIDQWKKIKQDNLIADNEIAPWKNAVEDRRESGATNATDMVAATIAAVKARFSPGAAPVNPNRQFQKVAHNAIERRYRNNINDRIRDLKNVVPALYKANVKEKKSNSAGSNGEEDDNSSDDEDRDDIGEIIDGVEVARKLNKATILLKAVEYIQHLKHTNELAERENHVLQQLLSQMPGGNEVLARFQVQKNEFQQAEYQRLIAERRSVLEQEKIERQRMLRERAAQRAALAELIPKPERKPYRRRAKKQQEKQQKPKNHAPSKRHAFNSSLNNEEKTFATHNSPSKYTVMSTTDNPTKPNEPNVNNEGATPFRNYIISTSNQSQLIH
ncbi:helix-loop-helix DNA-binding domain-containing protein [Mycotypha africana]|uniref:helix-loop-helix DNA-binding domain-containing protein n=1 Tax=Mycotypha africana TaxID=64632 RepID=UPI002300CDA7|nr:helix-loop-helix DNA-binding domain-containing protein [Mycotypha africana]KAI8991037.1 helix-loop-helix DNA-binding domain-containing protein [Mycotypha africana]